MTVIDNLADAACLALTIALELMIDRHATGVLRTILALAFAVYIPGRAVAINWRSVYLRSRIAIPVVLALTVNILVATTILWLHEWHPIELFEAEAIASCVLIVIGLWRRNHHATSQSLIESPRLP